MLFELGDEERAREVLADAKARKGGPVEIR
jgi:hypothetical protein